MTTRPLRPVVWIGSSKKDFAEFPDAVQHEMGFAPYREQLGALHVSAKPLKGFGGAHMVEIVEDHQGSAYRAVYTARFANAVYVLHAFQKKSRTGIRTDRDDIELVKRRLRIAKDHARHSLKVSDDEKNIRS
jgi:phage-related protein